MADISARAALWAAFFFARPARRPGALRPAIHPAPLLFCPPLKKSRAQARFNVAGFAGVLFLRPSDVFNAGP